MGVVFSGLISGIWVLVVIGMLGCFKSVSICRVLFKVLFGVWLFVDVGIVIRLIVGLVIVKVIVKVLLWFGL